MSILTFTIDHTMVTINLNPQSLKEATMHKYLILIQVPSTAPLFSEVGLNTNCKVRALGYVKANNSSTACDIAARKLDIPYEKLKALLIRFSKDGAIEMEQETKIIGDA